MMPPSLTPACCAPECEIRIEKEARAAIGYSKAPCFGAGVGSRKKRADNCFSVHIPSCRLA
jgi:hypothetical protein